MARAVDGVSFTVEQGRSFCLVGESGCGKSVTVLSILDLLPSPPDRVLGGEALFEGEDLLMLRGESGRPRLNSLRGSRIGMIFQEPMTSLNPVFRVGEQVAEPLRLHRGMGKKDALDRAVELLEQVGIKAPSQRARDYPHQLSGGMRQRVMIAMAMACNPALLIADEPTTALDVSVQGQILDLMREMRESSGSALLMITHDLDVVTRSADDMAVMYAGKIVESGAVAEVMSNPLHPYTAGLIASRPRLSRPSRLARPGSADNLVNQGSLHNQVGTVTGEDAPGLARAVAQARHERLASIPGTVPPPLERPQGCAFSNRCPRVMERCRMEMPELVPVGTSGGTSATGMTETAGTAGSSGSTVAGSGRLCRCWLHQ
ncbi:ABC transporter ATP-binding protein [Desulfovibrio sp. OttesenSCG-928-C06]|nr:ABC transporter ATP-binding protein [Desulfovibrio sp. OttesenSCG-928-C06]